MRNLDLDQGGIDGSDVSPEALATYDAIMELQEAGLISSRDAAKHLLTLNRTFVNAGERARSLQIMIGKNLGGDA